MIPARAARIASPLPALNSPHRASEVLMLGYLQSAEIFQ
jgi:hypothetical protein